MAADPQPVIDYRVAVMHPDTGPEAAAIQLDLYRKMSGEQRVELAMAMTEMTDAIARDGIGTFCGLRVQPGL